MPLVNLTARSLTILYYQITPGGLRKEFYGVIPPDAKLSASVNLISQYQLNTTEADGTQTQIPICEVNGSVEGLPDPEPETLYIVGAGVAYHPDCRGREDILLTCPGYFEERAKKVLDLIFKPYALLPHESPIDDVRILNPCQH